MLASWDIGESTNSTGSTSSFGETGVFDNPNADINRAGLSPWARTHIIKVTGNYLIPEPIGINLGLFLRRNSGQPLVRDFLVTGLNQGTISVRAAPAGEDPAPAPKAGLPDGGRFDAVTILDLRAEKQFTLPGPYGVLHVYADYFNVGNANTIWGMRQRSSSTYGRISSIVPPWVFRLGGSWDF